MRLSWKKRNAIQATAITSITMNSSIANRTKQRTPLQGGYKPSSLRGTSHSGIRIGRTGADQARQNGFYGVTNPFVLPDHSGVRDYDVSALNGGHLLIMLDNAKWIAEKQLGTRKSKKARLILNRFPIPKIDGTQGSPPRNLSEFF